MTEVKSMQDTSHHVKKAIGFAVFCGFIAFVVWHWTEKQYKRYYRQLSQGREIVAQVKIKQNEVSRNFQGTLVWQPIEKNENIFLNNSLQTGSSSTAEITLVTGSKILVGPSSIVRFDKQGDEFILDLLNGKIMVQDEATVNESSFSKSVNKSSLSVKTADGNKIKIKNSQIKIDSSKKEDVKIQVIKGQVEVTEKSLFKKSEKLNLVKDIEFNKPVEAAALLKSQENDFDKVEPVEILKETKLPSTDVSNANSNSGAETPIEAENVLNVQNSEARQPSANLPKPIVKVPTPKLKQIKVKVRE